MPLIWNDVYKVGYQTIDAQHIELFDKINELLSAMRKADAKGEIDKTFNFMADYVVKHFGTEEALMLKYSYPDYATHKEQHEYFIKIALGFKEQLAKGKAASTVAVKLQAILVDWLLQHIGQRDKKLGAFLLEKGA